MLLRLNLLAASQRRLTVSLATSDDVFHNKGNTFWLNDFLNDGAPHLEISSTLILFDFPLNEGMGLLVGYNLCFASKICFWVSYTAPQVRSLRTNMVHSYRNMLHTIQGTSRQGLQTIQAQCRKSVYHHVSSDGINAVVKDGGEEVV